MPWRSYEMGVSGGSTVVVVLKEQSNRDAGHHGAEGGELIPRGRNTPSVKTHLGCFYRNRGGITTFASK